MKIVIIGPGAMGCLFAFYLLRTGHEVWLLDYREERAAFIRTHGLTIEGVSGNYQIPFSRITTDVQQFGKADLVIIFVKAYATERAVKQIEPAIKSNTIMVTLQNGLGNIECITAQVPNVYLIAGTTAQGATLLAPGHIKHAGIGETIIGNTKGSGKFHIEFVRDLFMNALIPVNTTEDVMSLLWGKLLINCGINPITAIMQIKNGQLPDSPDLCAVMQRAVEEGIQVARSLGIRIPYENPVEKVLDVCRATADNRSSMLQDIEAGRKTEIEYMNGAIVRLGEQQGISVPVNRFLTEMVRALESVHRAEIPETEGQ